MEYHVFLSYSHKDIGIMSRIRDALRDAGLRVWSDEELIPGTHSWKSAIQSAIENSNTVVVILSPDAKKSEWVERELDYAVTCGTVVIPVLAHGIERDAVPLELINKQWIDLRTDYTVGVQQLVTAIKTESAANKAAVPQNDHSAGLHSTAHSTSTVTELDPWNPLDQLRLMLWLFLMPDQLVEYRHSFGTAQIRKAGAWLVGSLAWVSIALPLLAFSLGTIHRGNLEPISLFISWALIFVGWLSTSWLTGRPQREAAFGAFILASGITLVIWYLLGQRVGIQLAITTLERMDLMAALGIAFGIGLVVNSDAAGFVGGIVVGIILYVAMFDQGIGLDGSFSGIALVGMALLVVIVLNRSTSNGKRSLLNWIVVMASGVIYALLFWIYFLGGWEILKK